MHRVMDLKEFGCFFLFAFHPLCFPQKGTILDSDACQAGILMQAKTLTKRSFVNMSRDLGYYWVRLVIYILVSVCIGNVYFKIGTNYKSVVVGTYFAFF